MRSAKAGRKVYVEDSSGSEDEKPTKKIEGNVTEEQKRSESSSSESDIESYLQHPDKIDLSSEFFQVTKKDDTSVKFGETKTPVRRRLSSSDSDEDLLSEVKNRCEEHPQDQDEAVRTKLNFKQIQDYSKKMEEAKRSIEKYNARKKKLVTDADVTDLLAIGESKSLTLENISANDLHPSDFESSGDEWEEVKGKSNQEDEITAALPKHAIEITVNTIPHSQKKKQTDVLAAMKRRLNRIRKENQVLVHKVHLLCWIAHGNYINTVINNTEVLGMALSMLPSDKCYPADRTDLGYLEQILQWFKKTVRLLEMDEKITKSINVLKALQIQLETKKAYNKKYLVYMFVAILRALGIQCRLVLSFQVEPLRPPTSELHSLKSPAKLTSNSTNKAGTSKKVESKRLSVNTTDKGKSAKSASQIVTKSSKNASKKNQGKDEASKSESSEKHTSKIVDSNSQKTNVKSSGKALLKQNSSMDEKMLKPTKGNNGDKTQKKNLKAEKIPKIAGEGKGSKSTSSTTEAKSKVRRSSVDIKENGTKANKKMEEVTNTNGDKIEQKSLAKSISNLKKGKKSASTTVVSKTATGTAKNRASETKSSKDKNQNVPQVDGMDDTFGESTSQFDTEEEISMSDVDIFYETAHYPFNSSEVISEEAMQIDEAYEIPQLDGNNDKTPQKKITRSKINIQKLKDAQVPIRQPQKKPSTTSDYNSEDEFSPSPSKRPHASQSFTPQLDVKNDIINLIKGRIAEQKQADRGRVARKMKPKQNSDSDSDYAPAPVKKKRHDSDSDLDYFVPKTKVKKRIRVKRDESGKMKVLSSSSEDLDESGKKKNKGVNVWVEVFLEMEEKWITADVVKGQVHCVDEIYKRATHPVTYVVAWNNDNTLRDVTMRYCKNFSTVTRKLRVEPKWWEETIQPFKGKQTVRDKEEEDDLNRQQLDQPLPKSIAEYKNHPLYALKRHLLKFEAIYPPDIAPLGYIRGEAVYPRNSVYVCRSRDIWLKEAKVVKPGEKPYKIVKARPKWDKLSNAVVTDQMLEIFGIWQTMDYEPPTAENGIVPRNAFGNVELFKPCMLPKKTVHLRLPGLNRICKRMNIDCASAIVGFDFHCGGSVPTYDGFVVCEEYADQLIAAWELEQEDRELREKEKVEKRVYGNWKRLIKGLLIRERLNRKYNFDIGKPSTSAKKKKSKKGG
ncbi:unnamed protein product [Callosobruchus maculatus]|uniref:Rad4 beta-hairpin domain-containing protein n=1 Tax=Callosobruchus maculatus TaxID=64391 RepID=A0A653CG50_CALMS|nr:unnamed protein product [Callosobruchus maculatus]